MNLKFYYADTDEEDKIGVAGENGYIGSVWLYQFGDQWYWNIVIPPLWPHSIRVSTLREVVEIVRCCEAMDRLAEMA